LQWNSSTNAGFTSGTPWLPVDDDYQVVNIEAQAADPTSVLTLYHRLIALRRTHTALAFGDYHPVVMTGDLLAYVRSNGSERFLIALNLGVDPHSVSFQAAIDHSGNSTLLMSTHLDREGEILNRDLNLRANEGVIILLDGPPASA
jgi:alpha-glucosidase